MNSITPYLWFDGNALQAAEFYVSLFPGSKLIDPAKPLPRGTPQPMMVAFEVGGQKLMALNGGPHYKLSPAFSLFVSCKDQNEVDQYWNALIANGGAESQCGWLVDRFGLSWQIIPEALMRLMSDPDREKAGRVMQAMLKMQKIVVADLEAAWRS